MEGIILGYKKCSKDLQSLSVVQYVGQYIPGTCLITEHKLCAIVVVNVSATHSNEIQYNTVYCGITLL